MHSLTILDLDFMHADNTTLIDQLAERVRLPKLSNAYLSYASCKLRSLKDFLCVHAGTLREFVLHTIWAADVEPTASYRTLLETARDKLQLQFLNLAWLYDEDGSRLEFPNIKQSYIVDEPADEGFRMVDVVSYSPFEGVDDVKAGLSDMLSSMVWRRALRRVHE